MRLWYQFDGEIHLAPQNEGVYFLSESANIDGLVYIGRADNLRERLQQHPDTDNPCLQRAQINHFSFEETRLSRTRESQLIDYYNPVCNRV